MDDSWRREDDTLNEKESFQVPVLPAAADLKRVTVTASDLKSSGGDLFARKQISCEVLGYVETKARPPYGTSHIGWWPDPILASIDPSSFPLGTGPKQDEIWHSGYYRVVWANRKYRMIYFNMGHNDLDFEKKTNNELSFTFGNELQDELILNALEWLGTGNKTPASPDKHP